MGLVTSQDSLLLCCLAIINDSQSVSSSSTEDLSSGRVTHSVDKPRVVLQEQQSKVKVQILNLN